MFLVLLLSVALPVSYSDLYQVVHTLDVSGSVLSVGVQVSYTGLYQVVHILDVPDSVTELDYQ